MRLNIIQKAIIVIGMLFLAYSVLHPQWRQVGPSGMIFDRQSFVSVFDPPLRGPRAFYQVDYGLSFLISGGIIVVTIGAVLISKRETKPAADKTES